MNYTQFLRSTKFFDFESPEIQTLLQELKDTDYSGEKDFIQRQIQQACQLYLLVRDRYRYNPYRISFRPERYIASKLVNHSEGHCLDKSIILITGLRALGIPARLRLAKVKNHIGVERLVEKFGTNVMTPHGMVDIFLNGKWVKASPAFNQALCVKCNVEPLEFDGIHDSVFQEYDRTGGQFMDYLEDYGSFEDVPIDFIKKNIIEHYPQIVKLYEGNEEFDF